MLYLKCNFLFSYHTLIGKKKHLKILVLQLHNTTNYVNQDFGRVHTNYAKLY